MMEATLVCVAVLGAWALALAEVRAGLRRHALWARSWESSAGFWRRHGGPDDAETIRKLDGYAAEDSAKAEHYRRLERLLTLGLGGRK